MGMYRLRTALALTGLLAICIADGLAAENIKYSIAKQPKVRDFYPPLSIARGEEGRVIIRMCWNTDGKVVESTVTESSGNLRLDEAAVLFGKAYVFKPGIQNGVPVAQCVTQAVQFSTPQGLPR